MQLSTKEAVKLMRKLELELVECKHHLRGFVKIDGKRLFCVHCSFGCKDLPGTVPHRFRKSLRLSTDEFEVLRSCTMGPAQYVELLKAKGEAF